MEARGDPTIVIDRTVTQDLEVLSSIRIGLGGRIKGWDHRGAVQRFLLDPVDTTGHVDASDLEQCRKNVDDMMEALAKPACVVDAVWP